MRYIALVCLLLAFVACGPGGARCDENNLANDRSNCGACGNTCGEGEDCVGGTCEATFCTVGEVEACYTGADGTKDVGVCHGGTRTCVPGGTWSRCQNEVVPTQELCGNGIDENCSGAADEDVDMDNDGFTTCAGDCCDSTECGSPELVNPGAFDSIGNNIDDDCDGIADNSAVACDGALVSNSQVGTDYGKAIDLCKVATEAGPGWGLVSASFSRTDGAGQPYLDAHAIRDAFGFAMTPLKGSRLALLATGLAGDKNDSNPAGSPSETFTHNISAAAPADWLDANNGAFPNLPGCDVADPMTNDGTMLTLRIRAPSNARSFSLGVGFYSYEYPEWTCSRYNDFFVALLDSTYAGSPANPVDKNLAVYKGADDNLYPMGVNLAYNNTGLFRECQNGAAGCLGQSFSHTSCTSTALLAGTGLETAAPGNCDAGALAGGGTGWLVIKGNVVGGEVFTLRLALWDSSDGALDSFAVLDNFEWSIETTEPGIEIE